MFLLLYPPKVPIFCCVYCFLLDRLVDSCGLHQLIRNNKKSANQHTDKLLIFVCKQKKR